MTVFQTCCRAAAAAAALREAVGQRAAGRGHGSGGSGGRANGMPQAPSQKSQARSRLSDREQAQGLRHTLALDAPGAAQTLAPPSRRRPPRRRSRLRHCPSLFHRLAAARTLHCAQRAPAGRRERGGRGVEQQLAAAATERGAGTYRRAGRVQWAIVDTARLRARLPLDSKCVAVRGNTRAAGNEGPPSSSVHGQTHLRDRGIHRVHPAAERAGRPQLRVSPQAASASAGAVGRAGTAG